MVATELFTDLIEAASLAPSADNMQAWAFRLRDGAIEVFLDPRRLLPTDVGGMFGWIGVGAAVENLVIAAARRGLAATVELSAAGGAAERAALVRLQPDRADDPLAGWLAERVTDRGPYDASPLGAALVADLGAAVRHLEAGVHWTSARVALARMAEMDASSTYIRLEHAPLRDELLGILRFTRGEVERTRHGLDFEALGMPRAVGLLARQLRRRPVAGAVSLFGVGHLVAKAFALRLRSAGALCLVTARRAGAAGYIEAGRAMERIWLTATASGLAVQPHGVLPQYLTKVEAEPETFLPHHACALQALRAPFDALFPGARAERPAILLRIGRSLGATPRRSVRLPPEQLIRW